MTRAQIRAAIGVNLGGYPRYFSSTTTGAGSTTVIADTGIPGAASEHIGKWVVMTSGAASGEIRQVSANAAAVSLTVSTAFTAATGNANTYEMWDQRYPPANIHNVINQAIQFVTGKAYDPEEDVSLHLHGEAYRYVLPASFAAVRDLLIRLSYNRIDVDRCESGWTQQTNVTQVFDQTQRREGGASLRLVLDAATMAANDSAAVKTISSLDVSKYDTLEFWIKCSVAKSAGDFTIRLTSGSDVVSFSVSALTADTWTFVRVSMTGANARLLTAVTNITLRFVTDDGATNATQVVWIDDIRMAQNSSAKWETINRNAWSLDKEAGEIVFKDWNRPGYYLLKIVGGDEPVLLDADGTASEIDPYFVIAKGMELMLMANAPTGGEVAMSGWQAQVSYWAREAETRARAFPNLSNYREAR